MGSETTLKTLGDVCYITDGAHAKVDRQVSGVMYLTSKNIGDGQLKLDSYDFISNDCFSKLFTNTKRAQRRLQTGDVLMGIIGTFGNCYVYKDTDHFGISSSVAILRPDQSKLLPEYLYYYISSAKFKAIVEKFKGGSVQGYTNIATLKALPIPLPSVAIQKAIVENLIPLDDKITLNRQINQTLEQMAQALFKSWFVDFDPVIDNALDAGNAIPDELQARAEQRQALRNAATEQGDASETPAGSAKPLPDNIRQLFPNEFEESELGWVPEGWDVLPLSHVAKVVSGKRPPSKGTEKTEDEPIPVWGGNGVKWFTNVFLSDDKYIITGRVGTLGTVYKVNGPSWPSDNALVVRPLQRSFFEYVYQALSMYDIHSLNSGSTQPLVTQTAIKNIQLVFPSEENLLELFQRMADDYDLRIECIAGQNETLIKLRDTLLPKLISGELRLDEVESTTTETMTA